LQGKKKAAMLLPVNILTLKELILAFRYKFQTKERLWQ
jgi:hypothetical protein